MFPYRHQVGDRLHAVEHVVAAAAAPDAHVHLPVVDGGVEAHALRESGLELAAIRPPPVRSSFRGQQQLANLNATRRCCLSHVARCGGTSHVALYNIRSGRGA